MPPFSLYNLNKSKSPDYSQEYEPAAISVVANDSTSFIVMGNINGQLNISKVTANEISIILSVDMKQKIMAVNSVLDPESRLTVTILMENTIIRHSMVSDSGISTCLTRGFCFLSEIFSADLSTNAFNFVEYFDDIFVQCWDGSIRIINCLDTSNVKSISIPNFTLPGRMKMVGSTVVISQGNCILGFRIEKLLSLTGDQEYVTVSQAI
jgi:hypothetical protein